MACGSCESSCPRCGPNYGAYAAVGLVAAIAGLGAMTQEGSPARVGRLRGRGYVEVSGLPPIEEISTVHKQRPDRLAHAQKHGMKSSDARFKLRKKQILKLLKDAGVKVGRVIGHGTFADVHEIGSDGKTILKISGDGTEAAAWQHVIDMLGKGAIRLSEVPTLGAVHEVLAVPPRVRGEPVLYVIIMDRYQPLNEKNQGLIKSLDDAVHGREVIGKRSIETSDRRRRPFRSEGFSVEKTRRYGQIENARKYIKTLQAMAAVAMIPYDIHEDNVMMDERGAWKIIDLGMTEVLTPVDVPVLAGAEEGI